LTTQNTCHGGNALKTVKGRFILSSYPSDILDEYTKANNWHQVTYTKTIAIDGRRKQKRLKTEVLTANIAIRKIE